MTPPYRDIEADTPAEISLYPTTSTRTETAPCPPPPPGWRSYALPQAMLYLQPRTGLHIRISHAGTQHLQRQVPRAVMFGLTNRCNMQCDFCSRDAQAPSLWTAESAFTTLSDLAQAGVLEVAFGGGEPLMFRGCAALMRRLHAHTPLVLNVTTNGRIVSHRLWQSLHSAISMVRLSVYDDTDCARIATIWNTHGQRWGANVLVDDAALPRLPQRLRELARLGAHDVSILTYVGEPQRLLSPAGRGQLRDIIRHAPLPCRLSVCTGDIGLPLIGSGFTGADCGAGLDFVSVTAAQRVQACSFAHQDWPGATAAEILHAWRQQQAALAQPSPRSGCARRTAPSMPASTPLNRPHTPPHGPRQDGWHDNSGDTWRSQDNRQHPQDRQHHPRTAPIWLTPQPTPPDGQLLASPPFPATTMVPPQPARGDAVAQAAMHRPPEPDTPGRAESKYAYPIRHVCSLDSRHDHIPHTKYANHHDYSAMQERAHMQAQGHLRTLDQTQPDIPPVLGTPRRLQPESAYPICQIRLTVGEEAHIPLNQQARMSGVQIWQSFSGNNSGECLMVASFATVDDARALTDALLPHWQPEAEWSEGWRQLLREARMAIPAWTDGGHMPDMPRQLVHSGRHLLASIDGLPDDLLPLRLLAIRHRALHTGDTPFTSADRALLVVARCRHADDAVQRGQALARAMPGLQYWPRQQHLVLLLTNVYDQDALLACQHALATHLHGLDWAMDFIDTPAEADITDMFQHSHPRTPTLPRLLLDWHPPSMPFMPMHHGKPGDSYKYQSDQATRFAACITPQEADAVVVCGQTVLIQRPRNPQRLITLAARQGRLLRFATFSSPALDIIVRYAVPPAKRPPRPAHKAPPDGSKRQKKRQPAPAPRPALPEQALRDALHIHPNTRQFKLHRLWSALPESAVYQQERHPQPETALAHCQQLAQQHQLLISPSIREPHPLRWTLLRLMRQSG